MSEDRVNIPEAEFSSDAEDDPRQGLPSVVRVETAALAFQPDATKRVDPQDKYVRYTGVGTVRVMGPEEWKACGVNSEDYFEWNYLNGKRIPRSAFSDEQLQYLLRVDDRFELVEGKK